MVNRKAGILGAGHIAEFHIRAIMAAEGVELAAICDKDRSRAERLQTRWGIPKAYGSLEDMLADTDVDVVHILLPPEHHAAAAIQCLENGRDIFVEKPFSCSTEEVLRVQKTAQSFGKAIGVNHNNAYHPAFRQLVGAIREWKLGELEHITLRLNMPLRQLAAGMHSHWMFQSPGNIILELAPHPLSQITYLLGPVHQIRTQTTGKTKLNSGQPFYDTWQCSLICERGSAQMFIGVGREYHDFWIHAIGQDGTGFADMRRNVFTLSRKTRFLEPIDNLINGFEHAKQMAVSSISQFVGYALGFLKLRKVSDPFSVGINSSVAQFYEDLASGRSPCEGIERAMMVIEACDAIINNFDYAEAPWQAEANG